MFPFGSTQALVSILGNEFQSFSSNAEDNSSSFGA